MRFASLLAALCGSFSMATHALRMLAVHRCARSL